MAGVEARSFDSPDETRTPDKTHVELVRMSGNSAARMRLEAGWRWSDCIKPVVGGDSCQNHHLGVVLDGVLHVAHDDGTKAEVCAGQAYEIKPGHDAWVIGTEPFVAYEFDTSSAETYARPT